MSVPDESLLDSDKIIQQIRTAKRNRYQDKFEPVPYLRLYLFFAAVLAFILMKYLRYLNKEYHFVEAFWNSIVFCFMWANTKITEYELKFEKLFV